MCLELSIEDQMSKTWNTQIIHRLVITESGHITCNVNCQQVMPGEMQTSYIRERVIQVIQVIQVIHVSDSACPVFLKHTPMMRFGQII